MAVSGYSVWISLQNSAVIKLFHSVTRENLCDVNVAPAVTKMLAGKLTFLKPDLKVFSSSSSSSRGMFNAFF